MYMELPKALRIRIGHQFSSGGFQKGFMHSCTFLENDCNNDGYVESQLVRGLTNEGMDCTSLLKFKLRRDVLSICSYWSISNNPEYGNCFTFNANYNNDKGVNVNPPWEVTMTGGSATLSVVLYLDQLFYTPLSLSKKAGARITIHNPKVFPMTEEYGINLKPNTASNIG